VNFHQEALHNQSIQSEAEEEAKKIDQIVFTKRIFYKMMDYFGLGKDKETLEKLFWVLDKDDSGEVEYIEFVLGIQIMKQNTFKEKLVAFFDMCDLDGDGYVDKKLFNKIMKELNLQMIGKKLGSTTNVISREEFIDKIYSNEFTQIFKPFNLHDYFKEYESSLDIQSNNMDNMARLLKAYSEKEKIKENSKKYLD
jgi:Ca2+-binding EF-hand superfamily protein